MNFPFKTFETFEEYCTENGCGGCKYWEVCNDDETFEETFERLFKENRKEKLKILLDKKV